MARLVLLLGKSGTGKSTSLRNLTAKETSVISVLGKELPFKTDIKVYHPKSYADVVKGIELAKTPIVVIDDSNYLMSLYEFATIGENGYGKFARNAQAMVDVFNAIIKKDTNQTFYVLAHVDEDEEGNISMKTTGKMVADKFNLNGTTNIVLESVFDRESEEFVFKVKADGSGVKTPMGMFSTPTVPNDLKEVDKTINEYFKETK